jgi:putative ABC transport system ATP-binding protein
MREPAVVRNTRTDEAVVEVRDVRVTYQRGDVDVEAVRGVSFTVNRGDFVSIHGPSGSGKSTLLRAIAGLWPLNAGEVVLEGVPLADRSDAELSVIRRRRVGFVHQLFNLLPDLSAFDNVALPLQLDGLADNEVRDRVSKTMVSLGIETKGKRLPEELSGGEMLRVALARALVIEPAIILADEPTGSLDQGNSMNVLELFQEIHERDGVTLIFVTHDPVVATAASRELHMVDGRLVD